MLVPVISANLLLRLVPAAVSASEPAAPSIGTAVATGATTATLPFTVESDNGSAITSTVGSSTPAGMIAIHSGAGSGTLNFSGGTPDTSYVLHAHSVNAIGAGAESANSNSITTDEASGDLAALVASMDPGTWEEHFSDGIQAAVVVGHAGDSGNRVATYANSGGRRRGALMFVGVDHAVDPLIDPLSECALVDFEDSTNAWRTVFYSTDPDQPGAHYLLGSHPFQHTAAERDPPSELNTVWLFAVVPGPPQTSNIYRSVDDAPFVKVAATPFNNTSVPYVAVVWWSGAFAGSEGNGVLIIHSGNSSSIEVYDPYADSGAGAWILSTYGHIPEQSGNYHVVAAYSDALNCMVFGGGNGSSSQLARLNADGTVTLFGDTSPYPVGIHNGMNLASGNGRIFLLGNDQAAGPDAPNELWEVNPLDGDYTFIEEIPVSISMPQYSGAIMSFDLWDLGAVCYLWVDPLGPSGIAHMTIYKPAD